MNIVFEGNALNVNLESIQHPPPNNSFRFVLNINHNSFICFFFESFKDRLRSPLTYSFVTNKFHSTKKRKKKKEKKQFHSTQQSFY